MPKKSQNFIIYTILIITLSAPLVIPSLVYAEMLAPETTPDTVQTDIQDLPLPGKEPEDPQEEVQEVPVKVSTEKPETTTEQTTPEIKGPCEADNSCLEPADSIQSLRIRRHNERRYDETFGEETGPVNKQKWMRPKQKQD